MALRSFLKLEGMDQGLIEGDSAQKGFENWVQVHGIDHKIELPRNPHSGQPTGERVHQPFCITKMVDQASPLLYQACTTGEHMKAWELVYNRINEKGQQEQYFGVKLENAVIVSIRHYKPLTLLEENKPYADMEQVEFSYTKIIWQHTTANKEAADDWTQPKK